MRILGSLRWVLALAGCLILGAALGIWLYTLVGDHLFAVPGPILLASYLLAPLAAAGIASAFVFGDGSPPPADPAA
jgi:hypothetical protein